MYHPVTITSPAATIEASVLARGAPQRAYRRADGRMFVPGSAGVPYTLRVRNLFSTRIEVIVTVDGRHVLKDEPGDPHACRGMILRAGETYEFRGWRVSDDESREFLFGDPGASVAAQATGSTGNTGVIGFAAWREDAPWMYVGSGGHDFTRSVKSAAVAAPAVATYGMAAECGSLGTGIGASQDDRVGRTSFTRSVGPPDILVIGYDTEAELIRRGIAGPADPDPFPGTQAGYGAFRTL